LRRIKKFVARAAACTARRPLCLRYPQAKRRFPIQGM
jgi:hypothetical protein